jgi:hypothetical protein
MTDTPDLSQPTHLPPAPPVRRPVSPLVWAGLVLLVVVAAISLWVWRFGGTLPMTVMPAVSAVSEAAPSDAGALQARVAELEQQLADARAAPPVAAPNPVEAAATQALSGRLERLETAQRRAGRAAAAAIAADVLAAAAQSSQPFPGELTVLERLTGDHAMVAGLRPLAEAGAPTRAALAAAFPAVAARAAAAAHAPTSDQSFLSRAVVALGSLINVRRVDDLTGTGADAVLARAERHAEDGDLEGALAQMRTLPRSAQASTLDWRDKALRRIEIERRIAALRTAALRDLAYTDGDSATPEASNGASEKPAAADLPQGPGADL